MFLEDDVLSQQLYFPPRSRVGIESQVLLEFINDRLDIEGWGSDSVKKKSQREKK